MRKCRLLVFYTIVVLLALANQNAGRSAPAPITSATVQLQVYKLYFSDLADLRLALASPNEFDLLGIDLQRRFASLQIDEENATRLRLRGYRLEPDAARSGERPLVWSDEYYTYDRMLAELNDLVARYPSVARLSDLGPAWQALNGGTNRRLWAIEITRGTNPKPQILFDAEQHAREIVTPEIAMRLATYLLDNYGRDAEATYLVDNRDIWIVPMMNPDGHYLVENGSTLKRKNDDTAVGNCGEPYWGVDLNRNLPFGWSFAGADPNPCGETYYGTSAGSEPETQAIMSLIDANSFTFLMDYHSFGNLVLWPWGYQFGSAGLDPRLALTGAKVAQLTGRTGGLPYTPEQGSSLYLTSGNLLDWSYVSKNVLAFTTEIGDSSDWFDPPYSRVDEFWAQNKPPALYLMNIADDPDRIYGPEATGATVSTASIGLTGTVSLTATVSDLGNGGQNVAGAEFFVDTAGANGTGQAMSPVDAAYDSPSETVQVTIAAATIGVGRHTLLVRGRDAAGNWGNLAMTFVRVEGVSTLYFPQIWMNGGAY